MTSNIEVMSYWGTAAKNEFTNMGKDRLAVILPGKGYTSMAPLLYYSLGIALESGYDTLAVEYGFQRQGVALSFDEDSLAHLTGETKEAINRCLKGKRYNEILFIGKSLGTAVQRDLISAFSQYLQRHIFLTPLPGCISAIKETDCLAAVGTRDSNFKQEHISKITGLGNVTLIVIEGADHSLEKGSYKEDLKVLTEICGHIYSFINKQL